MSSVRTLQAIRGLLEKAVGLIDAELKTRETKQGPCQHEDYIELTTMRGPQRALCESCGVQFNLKEEDEGYDRPETMGTRRRG